MVSNRKQFLINAASGWGANAVFVIVGFILMPYIINRLGEERYGIYQLSRSALVFFMFLQLGMAPTLVRYFAKAIAKGDKDEVKKVSSAAQIILTGLGLVACIASMVMIPYFIRFYEIPSEYSPQTAGLLLCMSFSLLLNIIYIVPQGLVLAANRYDVVNSVEIVSILLRFILIVVSLECGGPTITLIGVAILLAELFKFIAIYFFAVNKAGKAFFFSYRYFTKKTANSLLGFSMLNLANSVAAAVVFQGPLLIIGKVLGKEMVTAFAPALLISNAMQSLLGHITRPLVPLASRERETNKGQALGSWAVQIGQLSAFVGFGIVLPLSLFGPELMKYWLGEQMAWIWIVVAVLSTAVAISQIQAANYFLALGGGEISPTVFSQIVLAVVVITGTLIGTIWLGWNLLSIAVYMGLCIFIRNTFYLAYAYSLQFSYHYGRYLWTVYGLPASISTGCLISGWVLKYYLPPDNIFIFVSEGSVLLLCYLFFCWHFLVSESLKQRLAVTGSTKLKEFFTAINNKLAL